jgi:site-specific DNA-methyltransferase (adenine-specific)
MYVHAFPDGIAVHADSTSFTTAKVVREHVGSVGLIIADPPYGKIVSEAWDKADDAESFTNWMLDWTDLWYRLLVPGASFYVWGGIGRPDFRPFFSYLSRVESIGSLKMANLITWKKRRGYGKQNDYLFTREECAWLVNGDPKNPRTFNVPYLDEKRGYEGYNKKYPAKSEYKRRTNVWTDITEILRGKLVTAQKPVKLAEIMIETHTEPGEFVIDPFAGSFTTALAARKLGRRFAVIEKDEDAFGIGVQRLSENATGR